MYQTDRPNRRGYRSSVTASRGLELTMAIARLTFALAFAALSTAFCVRVMMAMQPEFGSYVNTRKIRMEQHVDSKGREILRPVVRQGGKRVDDD